jgi:hypothetical protein
MFRVVVQMGQLEVRLETDGTYPDCSNDVTNRAKELLTATVVELKQAGWSPLDVEVEEEEEEEESDTPGF